MIGKDQTGAFHYGKSSCPSHCPAGRLSKHPRVHTNSKSPALHLASSQRPAFDLYRHDGIALSLQERRHRQLQLAPGELSGQAGVAHVHVLYCGEVGEAQNLKNATRLLAQVNCSLHHLKACQIPPEVKVASCHSAWFLDRSDEFRHALQALHCAYQFSLVEFADYLGLGFRPIQAKRTGMAFDDVSMIVKLHSSSQWLREANLSWMTQIDELLLDYCERYAFENADVQLAPCQYMLDYASSIDWKVKTRQSGALRISGVGRKQLSAFDTDRRNRFLRPAGGAQGIGDFR